MDNTKKKRSEKITKKKDARNNLVREKKYSTDTLTKLAYGFSFLPPSFPRCSKAAACLLVLAGVLLASPEPQNLLPKRMRKSDHVLLTFAVESTCFFYLSAKQQILNATAPRCVSFPFLVLLNFCSLSLLPQLPVLEHC